eukprot:Sdes_comp10232_c0_seq1m1856
MHAKGIVVFISGDGSNLQALIDAQNSGLVNIDIKLVVSNKKDAYGLQRARAAHLETLYFPLKPYKESGKSRVEYEMDLCKELKKRLGDEIFLIVLAGWMHILSPEFLSQFPNKVINLHPALFGQFDGKDAIERAYQAYKEGKITHTGIMVHKVIPEVDRGQVLKSVDIPILPQDSLSDLQGRIHAAEHALLVSVVKELCTEN